MDLGDVDFGDVLSDADGVLVVEGVIAETDVVVKRYAHDAGRREIAAYALLRRLDVPTLAVLGAGEDWLILQALDGFDWRAADVDDLQDPAVLRALAAWYDRLHRATPRLTEGDVEWLGRVSDALTASALDRVGAVWPELRPGVGWARRHLPQWLAQEATFVPTLSHFGFAADRVVVGWEASEALVLEPGRLCLGYREADLRDMASVLEPDAYDLVRAESDRLLVARGGTVDPREASVGDAIAHLTALVEAAAADDGALPLGVVESYAWLAARC